MRGISVVLTVKNEENRIKRCLESIKWANEIIIIDNGSSDSTLDICRQYTNKIFFSNSPFTGIRVNCGIEKACYEWILNIDADEIIEEPLKNEILREINDESNDFNGYYIPIRHYFMGRWLKYGGWYPSYTKRLYRNGFARYTAAEHHIQIEIRGRTFHLRNPILHDGSADIYIFVKKMNFYTSNSSRINFGKKKANWFDIVLRPPLIFFKRYVILWGFLDGFPGFVIAALSVLYIFLDKIKLKESEYILPRDKK